MKLNSWQKVQYRLLWWSCRAVGLLPERVLYFCLGGLIRLILYRLVRYRRQVVRTNLAHSFPEKSEAERREIERKFYHHLSEVFVDTILLASISRKRICERMVYSNVEEVEAAMSGCSWISAMSHFGSWELTINYVCHTDHNVLAVYRPLHNRVFDRFYHEARSRFGTQPVAMNDTLREVIRGHRPGERPVIVAMIADQTPPVEEIKHWFRFLNQDTPFFSGLEKISTRDGSQLVSITKQDNASRGAVYNRINCKSEQMLTYHTHLINANETADTTLPLRSKSAGVVCRDQTACFVDSC